MTTAKQKLNKSMLTVDKVEENAVIVRVDGWRMRVYFEDTFDKEAMHAGKVFEAEHYGDITDPHSIQFLKLK